MPKILLVEDDNNLREIYEARLQAEGYDIISAMDGEEALVVAKKEKPDLVISDVMMPRISGFEMLDILRNTDGLKDVKVIMLTALGQAEDKTRADSLGADRYLVKSQVTLEDIVKAAQELLGPADTTTAAPATEATPAVAPVAVAAPVPTPPTPVAPTQAPVPAPVAPVVPAAPAPEPAVPVTPAPAPAPEPVMPPVEPPTPSVPAPVAPEPVAPAPAPTPEPISPEPEPSAAPVAPPAPAMPEPALPTPESVTPAPEPSAPAPAPEPVMPAPVVPTPTPEPTPSLPTPSVEPPAPAMPEIAPTPVEAPAPAEPQPASTEIPAAVTEQTGQAQSASAEQDAIKAQIESFVNQNNQTAPGATDPGMVASAAAPVVAPVPTPAPDTSANPDDTMMANAIKGLVSDDTDDVKLNIPAGEKVVTPPSQATAAPTTVAPDATTPAPAPTDGATSDEDTGGATHKKIISPITEPHDNPQPDINELLAKEGLGLDDDSHVQGQPTPQNPTGLPTTPHPPGHVISPNGNGGVDPNSIAL